jgi:serine/threonine protein kinase
VAVKVEKRKLARGRERQGEKLSGADAVTARSLELQFVRELQVLYRIRHPHICTLLAHCAYGPSRCLVFEYCANGTLADRLKQTRHLQEQHEQQQATQEARINSARINSGGQVWHENEEASGSSSGVDALQDARLGWEERLLIARGLCNALAFLHAMR